MLTRGNGATQSTCCTMWKGVEWGLVELGDLIVQANSICCPNPLTLQSGNWIFVFLQIEMKL